MFKLSTKSKDLLTQCDERLQELVMLTLKEFDVSVLCGHRGEEEQNKMHEKGTSKVKFPNSKHNSWPSKAVDIVPCPIPRLENNEWDGEHKSWDKMAKIMKKNAKKLKINLIWGGDWVSFKDKPHFEIKD